MSRLCRLKTASHGDDGKWAYDEIVSLRKQRDELLAALELISSGEADNGDILSAGECQRIAYDALDSVKEKA